MKGIIFVYVLGLFFSTSEGSLVSSLMYNLKGRGTLKYLIDTYTKKSSENFPANINPNYNHPLCNIAYANNFSKIIGDFFCKNTNKEILDLLIHEPVCQDVFDLLLSWGQNHTLNDTFKDQISTALNWSGKGLNDIGNKAECIGNDLYYFFVEIEHNRTVKRQEKNQIYDFTFSNRSLWGLCFFKDCRNFIMNYFDANSNTMLRSYLQEFGITNFTNYNKVKFDQKG